MTNKNEDAIQPAAPVTAITPALAARQALAARLPAKYRDDVLFLERPTGEELFNVVSALPAAYQEKMLRLVRKTSPKKQGAHTTQTGFAPTPMKIFHGVGADPTRPKATAPGNFYTGDSRIMGESFTAVVLGFYQGRILWPPQSAGASNESKAPICVSADRQTGSKYGTCASCDLSRRPYTQGGCMPEVTFWLLDDDMTGIYELKFNKSSYGAGESLVKILAKSESIWDRWVKFESQERVDGTKRWFVQKAGPVSDAKNPEKANTPKELHELFSQLSTILDADVFYPMIADQHDRLKNSPDAGSSGAGNAAPFDEKAFLADTSDSPDYSKDV